MLFASHVVKHETQFPFVSFGGITLSLSEKGRYWKPGIDWITRAKSKCSGYSSDLDYMYTFSYCKPFGSSSKLNSTQVLQHLGSTTVIQSSVFDKSLPCCDSFWKLISSRDFRTHRCWSCLTMRKLPIISRPLETQSLCSTYGTICGICGNCSSICDTVYDTSGTVCGTICGTSGTGSTICGTCGSICSTTCGNICSTICDIKYLNVSSIGCFGETNDDIANIEMTC